MQRRQFNRATERGAMTMEEIDAWMQRRVAYFGQPCLTTQEYRAVVYSLFGLPESAIIVKVVEGKKIEVPVEMNKPTQAYVAARMHIRQQRVSQLLLSAEKALIWFEAQQIPGVGWFRLRHGRGAAKWKFLAPVLEHPIPPEPEQRQVSVKIVPGDRSYKLAFAGEL
jgi:hypothetical protein